MTNEITISKNEFALALDSAGLNVFSYIPDRITPPIVVMAPGSPYLQTAAIGMGEYTMTLDVSLIVARATNKQESENLDQLIENFLLALPAYTKLNSVGTPFELATANATYLASTVNLDLQITI